MDHSAARNQLRDSVVNAIDLADQLKEHLIAALLLDVLEKLDIYS